MPNNNYKHLKGQFKNYDYKAIGIPIKPKERVTPPRTASEHGAFLLSQINSLSENFQVDPERSENATRFFVTVEAESFDEFKLKSLENKDADVEIIKILPSENKVIIDSPDLSLPHLKKRINQYATELKSEKNPTPKNEDLVAPIKSFTNTSPEEQISEDLLLENSETDNWIEFICRGGKLKNDSKNQATKIQIQDLKEKFNLPCLEEFIATESIFYFTRMNLNQIKKALKLYDCILRVNKARDIVRNQLTLNNPQITAEQIKNLNIQKPDDDFPIIAILDSGVLSQHPLLKDIVINEINSLPNESTLGDQNGHGTRMAGISIYSHYLSKYLENNTTFKSEFCIESAKIYPSSNDLHLWADVTEKAIKGLKIDSKNRVFTMAVTSQEPINDGIVNTTWSQAIDQLVYNEGNSSNLICVSAGNTYPYDNNINAVYPDENLNSNIKDPAQAINALSIGAYTEMDELPSNNMDNYTCIAPKGSLSPFSSANKINHCIKPEVLFEGGNMCKDSNWAIEHDLLSLITTNNSLTTGQALINFNSTSCATALAANFAASLWKIYPDVRSETIRGLIVHSASWTEKMKEVFNVNTSEGKSKLIAACGYGVPSFDYAVNSNPKRVTIIIEDEIVNQDERGKRSIKFFELPISPDLFDIDNEMKANLKVTLSYFAEPNEPQYEIRNSYRGLDLAWDVQGHSETLEEFKIRLNGIHRNLFNEGKSEDERFKTNQALLHNWKVGKEKRSQGTVQSDELADFATITEIGSLSDVKHIAVYPRLGWWDKRNDSKTKTMKFSLIITLDVATKVDINVYNIIKQAIEIPVDQEVSIKI